ncbi:hypothetical protein BGZ76_011650 [Entomortierella beljakovae]|nr:hypothetical protein BGZ76_011650 [Entomortierella beljakovae]
MCFSLTTAILVTYFSVVSAECRNPSAPPGSGDIVVYAGDRWIGYHLNHSPLIPTTMRVSIAISAIAAILSVANANCGIPDAQPSDGDVAVYTENDCTKIYHNIGAMYSCQNWPDYYICSAVTRPGVVCSLYSEDGCNMDKLLYTVDSAGFRTMCPGILRKRMQSVYCWNA